PPRCPAPARNTFCPCRCCPLCPAATRGGERGRASPAPWDPCACPAVKGCSPVGLRWPRCPRGWERPRRSRRNPSVPLLARGRVLRRGQPHPAGSRAPRQLRHVLPPLPVRRPRSTNGWGGRSREHAWLRQPRAHIWRGRAASLAPCLAASCASQKCISARAGRAEAAPEREAASAAGRLCAGPGHALGRQRQRREGEAVPRRATQEQKADGAQEGLPPQPRCVRCCPPPEKRFYPQYQPVPQINMTILKGEKGDRGERGMQGKFGKTGVAGSRGHAGPKGQKGSMGAPGERCKSHYAAFSVGRKKPLHSNDYYQTLIFDTEFVNLYDHFNMFTGKFYCYIPGIYYFSLNVHTWNQKETYLHIMRNGAEVVILYAQVSDRSIMQSQSVMLELKEQDEVWVRLYKGERENAVFSDEYDTYITFSGHLINSCTSV
uniref:Uncharacterized protein n=1 Tax=Geospiza parvula TaxID=87175 RepID=A0A8C3MHW0_GEOPR